MVDVFNLSGRKTLITGASRGIGKATANVFLNAGSNVFISGLDSNEVDSALRSLSADSDTAAQIGGVSADLSEPSQREALISACVREIGFPDTVICNAGIDIIRPAIDYQIDDWRKIMSVNAESAFFLTQLLAKHWIQHGVRGVVVMTSSIAGASGIPTLAPYAASKGAIDQIVRTLAVEWASHGIRVNAVAPGYVETIMEGVTAHQDKGSEERIKLFTPLGRRATESEVAFPILFLASDAATYVTGSILAVDGGYTAQ